MGLFRWRWKGSGVIDMNQDTKITAADSATNQDDKLRFFTAGNQRMIVDSNGDVGIGIDPINKLHVNGGITTENRIYINNYSNNSNIFVDSITLDPNNFTYILNAPRPGTSNGGATHFINGAGRSIDGGIKDLYY